MKPPRVCAVTRPTSHRITRIAKIVHNMAPSYRLCSDRERSRLHCTPAFQPWSVDPLQRVEVHVGCHVYVSCWLDISSRGRVTVTAVRFNQKAERIMTPLSRRGAESQTALRVTPHIHFQQTGGTIELKGLRSPRCVAPRARRSSLRLLECRAETERLPIVRCAIVCGHSRQITTASRRRFRPRSN